MALYATYWRGNSAVIEWEGYKSLVMFGPPLVYAMIAWWRDKRRGVGVVQPETGAIAEQPKPWVSPGQLMPAQVMVEGQEQQ
jgi:hypothetical protein